MKNREIQSLISLLASDTTRTLGEEVYKSLPLGERSDLVNSKALCNEVYSLLKNRLINPSGEFDKQGRFYAHNRHLINVRPPSGKWPYSQMIGCRTLKYVKALRDEHFKRLVNSKNPFTELKNLV